MLIQLGDTSAMYTLVESHSLLLQGMVEQADKWVVAADLPPVQGSVV